MSCLLLAFVLSVLILGMTVLSIFDRGFTNSSNLKNTLLTSNYYESLYQEIDSNTKRLTASTGLPGEVLEGVLQIDEIRADVNSYLDAALRGSQYSPDVQGIRERLEKSIEEYFAQKKTRIDTGASENIKELTDLVTEQYSRSTKLPLIERINSVMLQNNLRICGAYGICAVIILFILCWRERKKRWYQPFLFYLYCSALAASIMLAVIPAVLLFNQLYHRLSIYPPSLYELITNCIQSSLQTLLFSSVLLGFIALGLLVLQWAFRVKRIKRRG